MDICKFGQSPHCSTECINSHYYISKIYATCTALCHWSPCWLYQISVLCITRRNGVCHTVNEIHHWALQLRMVGKKSHGCTVRHCGSPYQWLIFLIDYDHNYVPLVITTCYLCADCIDNLAVIIPIYLHHKLFAIVVCIITFELISTV